MQFHIERLDVCASTQEEARDRAHAGAPDGTVVVAKRMEAGHGQHGRSWYAPEGGVYLSIIIRGLDDPRLLTLALGNAVADALEVAGAEPQVKWVNDVFVDGKKIAGILVEGESTGDRFDFVVAGIGVNGNGDPSTWPHPLCNTATTLQEALGAEVCLEDLEASLLDSVAEWLRTLRAGDGATVLEAWRRRDLLKGHRVGFDPEGDLCAKVLGTAAGIDDDGRLLVDVDGTVQAYESGTVFLQDPAAD